MNIVLANAAFGDDPQRWPLPQASTPHDLWLRAVVAGGQGRYGSAMADLDGVLRLQRGGPLVSLAHSTRASLLRQLGWHDRARRWDGRAMTLAGSNAEAGADALIGLAADALGVGRFAASATALGRAGELLTGSTRPRLPVRLAWVSAELAMSCWRRRDSRRARRTRRRAGRSVRFGAPRREIRRHPGRSTVQRRGARGVAVRSRSRAAGRGTTGTRPAALGVGLPAGRHRQRRSHGRRGADDS